MLPNCRRQNKKRPRVPKRGTRGCFVILTEQKAEKEAETASAVSAPLNNCLIVVKINKRV